MKYKYLKNVTTLTLNQEKCIGCGMCLQVCPHEVFAKTDKKAQIVQKDLCMECGACAANCNTAALKVNAGVGCALAVVIGWLTRSEPNCDCVGGNSAGSGGCCSD